MPKAENKIGRPATISREQILSSALTLAGAKPGTPVSISAIARDLGVTPMALYTYFGNKDELMQALSARLLDNLRIEVVGDATPTDRVAIWSHSVRRYFLDHPQLINMLTWEGGHVSVAWLNRSKLLFDALEEIGYEGKELGKAALWVWNSVMGTILWELHERQAPGLISDFEITQLEEGIAPQVQWVRDFIDEEGYLDRFFEFNVDRLLVALNDRKSS